MIKITFLPDKKNIKVNKGTTILEALESVGININVPCGGKGICGKCKILINKGITTTTPIEEELLSGEEIKKGFSVDSDLRKVFLNLEKPSLDDQRADWERIKVGGVLYDTAHKVFILDSRYR